MPFRRGYLDSLFERCADDSEQAALCLQERARTEQLLGDLDARLGNQLTGGSG